MRKVGINMLKPDMLMAQPLYHAGQLLLKSGTSNIIKYQQTLNNIGVNYIYIEDEHSDGIEIPDIVSRSVRQDSKNKLREVFELFAKKNQIDIAPLVACVNRMASEIIYSKSDTVSASDMSTKEDETIAHSVNTAILSGLIGKEMGYNETMVKRVIYGAILHDIGKVKLNPRLFMTKEIWTQAEKKEYEKHCQIGYDMLKPVADLTELSKVIVLMHRERLDGSGYPSRLKGDILKEVVKVVAIADEFDTMVKGLYNQSPKMSVNKAMEQLTRLSMHKFDAEVTAKFMKRIALYPNGCMIKLSNGFSGLVESQSLSMPTRPVVRLISDASGYAVIRQKINLMKELSLTIVDSEIELTS